MTFDPEAAAGALLSRRAWLALSLGALAAGTADGPARAQVDDPRPPTIDISNLSEIAPGVWVIGDHRVWLVPNVGIVLGKDAALVIDTGLGPANGERVLDVARRLAGRRRLILTMTHFHPEHGYGAQVFRRDATILYNRVQRDELAEKGTSYLALFRRTQSRAAAAALEGTEIVMPHTVYDGRRSMIDLGGRTVELETWGTAHTRGDQTVFLPRERILFAGDLIEQGAFPIFPWFPPNDMDVSGMRWAGALDAFQRLDPAIIVPGHGAVGDIRIAQAVAAHMRKVDHDVRARRQNGETAAQVLTRYKPQVILDNPAWQHRGLIDWELAYCNAAYDRSHG